MNLYNVHIYREMRLRFDEISAETPQAAADIASKRLLHEADHLDECDGETFAALVDEECDHDYEHSKTIDFEAERQRNAAPKLLALLEALLPYAEGEAYSLEKLKDSPGAEAEAETAWKAVEAAEAAIAEAKAAGITPVPAAGHDGRPRFEVEHDPKENSDRVYVLVDGKFDVAIIRTDEGIVVDVYPKDGMEAIASTYAFDFDADTDEAEEA